jgi:hypothetical protein
MVLQDTYNTLASTGNIIIHEIEENWVIYHIYV